MQQNSENRDKTFQKLCPDIDHFWPDVPRLAHESTRLAHWSPWLPIGAPVGPLEPPLAYWSCEFVYEHQIVKEKNFFVMNTHFINFQPF